MAWRVLNEGERDQEYCEKMELRPNERRKRGRNSEEIGDDDNNTKAQQRGQQKTDGPSERKREERQLNEAAEKEREIRAEPGPVKHWRLLALLLRTIRQIRQHTPGRDRTLRNPGEGTRNGKTMESEIQQSTNGEVESLPTKPRLPIRRHTVGLLLRLILMISMACRVCVPMGLVPLLMM